MMTLDDHVHYAAAISLALQNNSEPEPPRFSPVAKKSRNAARAMAAILCQRLFKSSNHRPIRKSHSTYEWKHGVFNCRNIADRGYFWTNVRPDVADSMHAAAESMSTAYLLSCCEPTDTVIHTWAIPEPVLHLCLAKLPFEERGQKYTFEISTEKQRIERHPASPDMTSYYQRIHLQQDEVQLLEKARQVDAAAKRERAVQAQTNKLLAVAEIELSEAGVFDPNGVVDARERVLSSIVKRRGQPAFRQQLLQAYNGRCAITGCNVTSVLDAAHIVSYKGPETNHPTNGLLLRTDLHTLFDLKLVAVDVETMTLIVSPRLLATNYKKFSGKQIMLPESKGSRPSCEALRQHREESGL